ncbi:hypothetical protein EXIGLDRAFT_722322 [Exidia glandulosa HHB12029]|uniref:F-box domain-containing protein n=1 Tax=Exidia glandulosa HHB12029 TaxID=1314781 RepID=A0A165N641_EXIGL|nr:hypothetical protein EXIGLDRAFT_722322 [Exidia glandulosa HHB12029]
MSFEPIPTSALAADLSRQIALEEMRAAELELELATLRQTIARKKFIVAPIRRLPWEMLAAICKAAIQDDPFFILTLAHVCRSFRHAALVSPSLWATFSVNVTNRNVKELVDLFLKHSGSVPLNVTIPRVATSATMCQKHIDQFNQQVVAVMRKLHPHQHRLRSLDLSVGGIDTAQAAVSVCKGPAPELQRLQITLDCDQEREKEELAALKDAFQPCPNLRILKLQHCELPLAFFCTTHTPFANVASLSLNHLCGPLSRLKANLDLMPNLRSLFCMRWHVPIEDLNMPKIVLPSLKQLTVVDESSGTSGLSVLRSLATPGLKRLTLKYLFNTEFAIEYPEDEDDFNYQDTLAEVGETVRDFLSRSGWPRLVELELHHCEMPIEDLVYILRRGDVVEELSLAGRLPTNLFKHLAGRPLPKRRACVPRMHTLLISDAVLKPKMIKKIIEVRNVHPLGDIYRPLQKIKLVNCPGISEGDRVRWSVLDPARLTIERVVTDPPPPRPIDLVTDMLDAMVFGPYGPMYF